MTGALSIGAALFLGLAASGHCLVMCGGITAALGVASARRIDGRPRLDLLIAYQFGRIVSYSFAGLLFAGILGSLIALLDIESVRRALRVLAALALVLGALVAFGQVRDPGSRFGQGLWSRLAPLGRRLLPIDSLPRAVAFGAVWGWMPCGFVYTVLLIATLQQSAIHGAMIMAAFGVGTAPALLVAGFGAHRLAGWTARAATRRVAGSVLLITAAVTFSAPMLVHAIPGLHGWLPTLP